MRIVKLRSALRTDQSVALWPATSPALDMREEREGMQGWLVSCSVWSKSTVGLSLSLSLCLIIDLAPPPGVLGHV